MFKSSSQAGSKASMSSVSSKMLLCLSNPSKSMNLEIEDICMAAALHKVFAVSDQPKANTLLTWAAHPCQEVDNIPHPYPSLPCSALWLLAIVEVRPAMYGASLSNWQPAYITQHVISNNLLYLTSHDKLKAMMCCCLQCMEHAQACDWQVSNLLQHS